MPIKSSRSLVEAAKAEITTLSPAEAMAAADDPGTVLVDIRDIRELGREGRIPGAIHAPRGMLEFWIDPESPYYRKALGEPRRLILFCAAAWRSALAAKMLQDMGHPEVAEIDGGFKAWKEAGLPVDLPEEKT